MSDEARDAEDWAVLSTYDSPALARMTLDFLRDHGIPVQTRGDSPEGLRNLFSPFDIRIVVPSARLEEAREALVAFTADPAPGTPFRGPLPPPELASAGEEADVPATALRTKRGPFAFVLALLVPIGGGHFYAQHNAAGVVLAASFLVLMVGAAQTSLRVSLALAIAAGTVVALDALVAMFIAVRRYNEKRIPSPASQRATAFAMVGVALGAGFAWSQLSGAGARLRNADLFEKCENHDSAACFDLARWHERNDPSLGIERIQDLYRRACSLGDSRGCAAIP